jgi:Mn-dependent DtxR family transcriptional regulator
LATTEATIKATRDSLVQIVDAEPRKYSQAELARILGVSRQRVHELVKRLDLNHLMEPKQWSFYCLDCGKPIRGRRRCRPCWRKLYGAERVSLSCDFCGKQFERKKSETRRHKFHFCSTSCRDNYAARYYPSKRAECLNRTAAKTR